MTDVMIYNVRYVHKIDNIIPLKRIYVAGNSAVKSVTESQKIERRIYETFFYLHLVGRRPASAVDSICRAGKHD